jgi:hypothetical protein
MLTSKEIKENRHKLVDIYKVTKGCVMCGYNEHPSSLCFDHLPNEEKSEHVKNGYSKKSCAGGMYRLYSKKYDVKQLIEEIKKCRILCHNCHMSVTHSTNKRKNTKEKIESIEDLEYKLLKYENQLSILT